jgi:hypothetical protein
VAPECVADELQERYYARGADGGEGGGRAGEEEVEEAEAEGVALGV